MNTFDILLILLLTAATVVGVVRGFGRTLFDVLGLYGALCIASASYAALASVMPGGANIAQNQALTFAGIFVVCSALALVAVHFLHDAMPISLGMIDRFAGVFTGFLIGLVLAHGIVQTIDIHSQGDRKADVVATSAVGQEMLNFSDAHAFLDTITSLTAGPQKTASVN
jgi:uncharacterized membrane protein required for colicin V production